MKFTKPGFSFRLGPDQMWSVLRRKSAAVPTNMFPSLRMAAALFGFLVSAALMLPAATGCGPSSQAGNTVTVFAAASLTDPFQEIARQFESMNHGVSVRLNFAGSQRLRSQLELGAAADIFAPADEVQMDLAENAGLVEGEAHPFASTTMAFIAHSESGISDVAQLAGDGTAVVIPHRNVPAGRYARLLLQRLSEENTGYGDDFGEDVLANVVSEETSVKFVEQKVVLGQADAGIVYIPGARTATADGSAIELPMPPMAEEVRARYLIARIKGSEKPDWADRFISFVLSEPAQEVLANYGFESP